MKTFEKILAWVGFIHELLTDGKEKYEKHFSTKKAVNEQPAEEAQELETKQDNE